MKADVLAVTGVSKNFGAVSALRDINLTVRAGEIVALLGDNGAGKSTLMNVICGSATADGGSVLVDGEPLTNLADARRLGVGVVYQDLALAPHLNLAENLFLGNEAVRRYGPVRVLQRQRMRREATEAIERLGISTLRDVTMPVGRLSGGQRQVLAVARAMKWAKNLILLDEPTAALGPKQVGIVLDSITTAASHGLGVVLVSHDIPSVLKIADRIVVLRHGTIVEDRTPAGLSVAQVVTMMVGDE
ncbi:monosaccharide ABC transporter ATP-binding protein, CUT2 family [Micromonospora pallida]|uniref:Monosaccharide ABC transporter ATP-binding protein, CUT2 family n=1 Tax=Micromonospora pallida TaxID=145854 RepID=A0A1C6T589_9ACTN|nr:ATP-binding cassette domain-containing protein [Micromonospora pallida]SCL37006.1 monosaccharide ABC transporter ATP-binding protein, CUT2 family [Micromonospora pallida]